LKILHIGLKISVPVPQLVCTHKVIPTGLGGDVPVLFFFFLSEDHLLRLWEMRPGFPEHIRLRTRSLEHTYAGFWLGKYQMEIWQL